MWLWTKYLNRKMCHVHVIRTRLIRARLIRTTRLIRTRLISRPWTSRTRTTCLGTFSSTHGGALLMPPPAAAAAAAASAVATARSLSPPPSRTITASTVCCSRMFIHLFIVEVDQNIQECLFHPFLSYSKASSSVCVLNLLTLFSVSILNYFYVQRKLTYVQRKLTYFQKLAVSKYY